MRFKETPRLFPDHLRWVYIEKKVSSYSMCTRRAADLFQLLELCSCVALLVTRLQTNYVYSRDYCAYPQVTTNVLDCH